MDIMVKLVKITSENEYYFYLLLKFRIKKMICEHSSKRIRRKDQKLKERR
jgi:hypothetical protein